MSEELTTAAELFDAIGAGYEEAFGRPPVVDAAVRELLAVLPPSARVLDVGSGTGRPVAADLVAAGHRVTGIDVSAEMVRIAREQVPGAEFVQADVREWESEPESWDAVCAFFPFLQLARAETERALGRIMRLAGPGRKVRADHGALRRRGRPGRLSRPLDPGHELPGGRAGRAGARGRAGSDRDPGGDLRAGQARGGAGGAPADLGPQTRLSGSGKHEMVKQIQC